ncbi:MAG: polymer-forming cytoskeletal protein, partial [Candidatus Saccharibacteria bacterium]|nr:polymer-forming cytoskeletal protein [Candidatus Saccharibacteria bacterium]
VLIMAVLIGFIQPVWALTNTDQNIQTSDAAIQSADSHNLEQINRTKIETSEHDISFNKQINGDVFCASSERCVVDGAVMDDALVVAMTVEIRGEIKGDLRAIAKELVIESGAKIHGNMSIFAPKLTIKKGAVIDKDAMLSGGVVRIEGQIGRDVMIASEETYIEGQIGRDAKIKSTKHTRVADSAKVIGNLANISMTKDITESVIEGEFKHEDIKNTNPKSNNWISGNLIWSLSIGALLIIVMIFRPQRFYEFSQERFKLINIFYIGIGYAILIGVPIVALLLATTIIGISVTILAMIIWVLMLILAIPMAIYYVSNNTLAIFDKKNEFLAMLIGVIIYALINSVPILAVVMNLTLVGLGAGLFVKFLVSGLRRQRSR